MANNSPFHRGEQAMQARVGKREELEHFGRRTIRAYMPDQHREFFSQLPFIIAASVDDEGWPWASIVAGRPGFIQSPEPTRLQINATVAEGDPLKPSIKKIGTAVGLVGVDVATRRRNRMNGNIIQSSASGFSVAVDESFGNCAQYIQTRSLEYTNNLSLADNPEQASPTSIKNFTSFDTETRSMISAANTLYIASFSQEQAATHKVDASHRGGKPGFIKIENNALTVPDFSGNNYFNTLGNLLLNPKAGLIFINFETGRRIMLTGLVEILNEDHPEVITFDGAERAWRFTLDHGLQLDAALPFKASLKDYSPSTLMTGNWQQATKIIGHKKKKQERNKNAEEADSAVIEFTRSGFKQAWNAGDPSILEIAEFHGLTPKFGCRSGSCGACITKIKSGAVTYRSTMTAHRNEDEALICCAVPAKGSSTVVIDL